MQCVIHIDNISKQYRLGEVSTGTIAHDINRWWHRVIGNEDPYLKIGEENDRTEKGDSEYIWALRNISFEVNQGEVLGIIGRNGAGKSTLLKILSRTTSPTFGEVRIKGRVASLLEVGTGFHPELSGRDNVYLNGAIMGMTKSEIKSKFDEIVDFAGVERYIDTPVKRYSSGMYVRLAFAVAAHLEPEILIVDEVLAVGDAEFQQKCLGKMKDVSNKDGRTVLFVSHNMTAITSLCESAIYLRNGKIDKIGMANDIVQHYLSNEKTAVLEKYWENGNRPRDEVAELLWARVVDETNNKIDVVNIDVKVGIQYQFTVNKGGYLPLPNIHVSTLKGEVAFISAESKNEKFSKPGTYCSTVWIPANFLNQDTYMIGIALSTMMPEKIHFYAPEALSFEVLEDINRRNYDYKNYIPGVVRPDLKWETVLIK